MKTLRLLSIVLAAAVVMTAAAKAPKKAATAQPQAAPQIGEVGQPLPAWTQGCLDIHAINTAQGESSLLIFPDGTTMMIDAGECRSTTPNLAPPRPDSVTPPYKTYAAYVKHFSPTPQLDYLLLTHFHTDHMGEVHKDMPWGPDRAFRLTGIAGVGTEVGFKKVIDRAYPDYSSDSSAIYPISKAFPNYRKFIQWHHDNKGAEIERFIPGRNDQIVLAHSPQAYPTFRVQNLYANGVVWTGVDTLTRNHFVPTSSVPENQWPDENQCSIGMRISYGPFDYFTGGDLPSVTRTTWQNLEDPVGRVCGPVDAMKANHHMNYDSNGIPLLSQLRPQVVVVHSRKAQQPDIEVLRNIQSATRAYPGTVKDVYSTNLHFATPYVAYPNTEKMPASQGHIVIRVLPGGNQFYVYSLSDADTTYNVTSIHGPYTAQ